MDRMADVTATTRSNPSGNLPASVLTRIRDLLPTTATEDRYLTLPLVCRHWHATLDASPTLGTLVFDGGRPQLARYIHSLHSNCPRASHVVVRNIDTSWFTSSYGPDAIHPTWLAQLLVHHAPELRTLALERVEPLSVDAVTEFVTQVAHLVSPRDKKGSGSKDAKDANFNMLFPHLNSLSIVGLRNVDPRTLHAFLSTLGAIATPTLSATVTRLRLSNIDFALNHTLLAAILPPPAPDTSAKSSASSSTHPPHHSDAPPTYSDSQLAHATSLTSLDLSLNPDTLTDTTLASVLAPSLAAMASLTSLSLAGCIQLSPRGLTSLTRHTPWLAHLNVAGCPLMPADLGMLAQALLAVRMSLSTLDITLASAGTQGSPTSDSPQWADPRLDHSLLALGALRRLALAYTDDDALPCVCSGLQLPLPTLLALVAPPLPPQGGAGVGAGGLTSVTITWRPGPNHHGGIPCGLIRRLVTHAVELDSKRLEVMLVGKNALRSDRMVYYDRASPVGGMLTVAASLRGCAENKCLGEGRGMGGGAGRERNDRQHQAEGDYLVDQGFVGELNRTMKAELGGNGRVKVRLVTFEMMKD